MTRYNNAMYRIDDIDWNHSPTDTFESRDGPGQISYIRYHEDKYGKTVQDGKQHLLVLIPTLKNK